MLTAGAVGVITMTCWSLTSVLFVAGARLAGMYWAPDPMGMFQIDVLENGWTSGLRVPPSVSD